MDVQVNIWGVLAATVAAMVIGAVWYSPPVLGDTWKKLVKLNEKKMKEEASKAYLGMLVLALLSAYVVAHVSYLSSQFFGASLTSAGVTTGFWLWAGVAVPVIFGNGMFEQRPVKLSAINAGNQLVTLVTMGLVIGLIGV